MHVDWTAEIEAAAARLDGKVLRTPLFHSPALSAMNGGRVYLKLESEQYTGSFKARGALNRVLTMSAEEKAKGMVTASSGNHAQGFARALAMTGDSGVIYLPENAEPSKVAALKNYGAELRFHGDNCLDTELHAASVAESEGLTWVSPYNHPMNIAGQGTIGKEILEDLPADVVPDAVLACVGGGSLVCGVAAWFRTNAPGCRIVGCQPTNSPEMSLSVKAGEVVELDEPQDTLSDGSAGGLAPGTITFELCREWVDNWVLATEEQIAEAIRWTVNTHHKIIEGAAGVALSAFLHHPEDYRDQTVVIVICGANISTEKLKALL